MVLRYPNKLVSVFPGDSGDLPGNESLKTFQAPFLVNPDIPERFSIRARSPVFVGCERRPFLSVPSDGSMWDGPPCPQEDMPSLPVYQETLKLRVLKF